MMNNFMGAYDLMFIGGKKPTAGDVLQLAKMLGGDEYAQYKLNESRDHDFGKLAEKVGKLIAESAWFPINDYLKIVNTVKDNFPDVNPLRVAKSILEENAERYGDKNSVKIAALEDAEKEIIIKYHETPSHGGDGIYIGGDKDKAKRIRMANGRGYIEKKLKRMEEGKQYAAFIVKKLGRDA